MSIIFDPDSTTRITDLFRVVRYSAPGASGSTSGDHVPDAGMAEAAAALLELAKQSRKAEGRKTLPTIEPWVCSFKHRLLPSTQASLKKLIRELKAYLKIDSIRETAYITDEAQKATARKARNSALIWGERNDYPPGVELSPDDALRVRVHAGTEALGARFKFDQFTEANDTMSRIILGAVKDPSINNQLSDLYESQLRRQVYALGHHDARHAPQEVRLRRLRLPVSALDRLHRVRAAEVDGHPRLHRGLSATHGPTESVLLDGRRLRSIMWA